MVLVTFENVNCFPFCCSQVVALKKTIRELEQKLQDQDEELDDQAGQIQMLEQVSFVNIVTQL